MAGNKEFGKHIQRLREAKGYSQEQLAELVGVEYQTISRIETGYYFTSYENLQKIAKALNINVDELINGSVKQEFEVKILMGVKNLTGLAGVDVLDNTFFYGVEDGKPQIHLAGRVNVGTPEERKNALNEIIKKFNAACWMFDHKDYAEIQISK